MKIYLTFFHGRNSLGLPPTMIKKAILVEKANQDILPFLKGYTLMTKDQIEEHCFKTHKQLKEWRKQ